MRHSSMVSDARRKATTSRRANSLAICDVCGKQLARHSDMPRHKRLHDPEPERWMHWCPEPNCDYGSMQLSNLKNHIRKHTGQRLYCQDDPACNYFTFDKSALLRHRQRRHGYKTRSTAPKNRNAKKVPKKCGASEGGMDTSHKLDNRDSNVTECPCLSSSDCRIDGTMDETHISQGDRIPLGAVEQSVGSIDESLEGHAKSRFPVSFARTHLPVVPVNRGSSALPKHCSRCTCKGHSNSRPIITRFKGANLNSDAVSCPVSMIYRHVESFSKKSFFTGPTVEDRVSTRDRWLGIIHS
ncbi:hypothetical protein BJY52DRAFT_481373 [Lactarius psammicola]|nr:hypothetical protein BJY52DRAFT_481373 [Lactarius psammicola]